MEAWQERVVVEADELLDKLQKLNAFLAAPPANVSSRALDQLKRQRQFMADYHDVLKERIAEFQ